MKWTTIAALFIVALPDPSAAQERSRRGFESPDWVQPRAARAAAGEQRAAALATPETVGDPDSFGRPVKFLGVAQTFSISLQPDCSGSDPTVERCQLLSPAPAVTSFAESDLARIELPARSAKSLLCFSLTPFVSFQFGNDTGLPQPSARFTAYAQITVESPVLADPALLDPNTGLPFGGQLTLPLSTYRESRSLAAGERAYKGMTLSRNCVGGLVGKSALVGVYGLSAAQADEFFRRPITLRFGASGTVQLVDFADYFYGVRIYGD